MTKITFQKTFLQTFKNDYPNAETKLPKGFSYKKIENPAYRFYYDLLCKAAAEFNWHRRPRIRDEQYMIDLLHKPNAYFCTFHHEEDIVGYGFNEAPENDSVEISDFAFFPELRGQGFGKTFLPILIDAAFKTGASRVWLSTRSTNDPRVATFYQSMGMKIYKTSTYEEELLSED